MNQFHFSTNIYITATIGLIILLLAALPDWFFSQLSLEHAKVTQGEIWRVLSSNFVHFGWPHTLMNLAAFLLCGFTFFNQISALRFLGLLFFCCLCVGVGIYFLNPEYETYAGLSGAIHGLIVAGLLLNKRHSVWINGVFIAVIFAKIFHEHQATYQTTQLQDLLPVAVAYDAHLYGAIAGAIFGIGCLIFDYVQKPKLTTHQH